MKTTTSKCVSLALALLVILACGGNNSGGSGSHIDLTRSIPLTVHNASATGTQFLYPGGSVALAAGDTSNANTSVGFTAGSNSVDYEVSATPTGGAKVTSSTTIGRDEVVNNVAASWDGTTLTLTKS